MIVDHPLTRLAALPWTAPAHALSVYLLREVEILVKSVAVPVLGGRMTGLASRTLAPRTVRGRVDESTLTMTRHAPPLPVCNLDTPCRGLLTATGTAECACALGATVRGCDDCAHDRLAVARPGVTAHGHMVPLLVM